jgi:gamma-butyrobetaine dioxygenase
MLTSPLPPARKTKSEKIENFEELNNTLAIRWGDEHQSVFHYVWLFDNCFCAHCGDEYTEKRMLRLAELPLNVRPRTVSIAGPKLQIVWSTGHTSTYDPAWLRAHCYSMKEREHRHSNPILWASQLPKLPELPDLRRSP